MAKVCIVFNPFNIDSMIGALCVNLMVEEMYPEETVSITFLECFRNIVNFDDSHETFDETYVVGVSLAGQDLKKLTRTSNAIRVFSYNGAEIYDFLQQNAQQTPVKDSRNVEDTLNNSMASIVIADEWFADVRHIVTSHRDLMTVVEAGYKYWNLIPMSGTELVNLFTNLPLITDYLYSDSPTPAALTLNVRYECISQKVFARMVMRNSLLTTVRGIVNRNMEEQLFGDSRKSKYLPTLNIGQEFAHDAIRLVGMAHKEVVTYEDIKNQRYWKVLAENQAEAIKIADLIPHKDSWFDGKLLCLQSDLPSFHK